jgi:hypothetical protein
MTDKELQEMKALAVDVAAGDLDAKTPAGKLASMVLMMYHIHPSQMGPKEFDGPKAVKTGAAATVEAFDPQGKSIGKRG